MKQYTKNFAKIIIPSALALLQACQPNPELSPAEIALQTKKRPIHNQEALSKAKTEDSDFQEVNTGFVSDYSDQNKQTNEELFVPKNTYQDRTNPVQKLRDEAARYNYKLVPMQSYTQQPSMQPTIPADRQAQESDIVTNEQQSVPVQNSSDETFEIQAGSYQSEAGAMKVVQKFEASGIRNIRVDRFENRHTIRINNNGKPFTTRDEASKALQDIIEKTQHYDIMVVKNKI